MAREKKTKKSTSWTVAFGLGLAAIGLILALGSYHAEDPSFNTLSKSWRAPLNVLGYVGSWIADAFLQCFGYSAWLWPTLFVVALLRWFVNNDKESSPLDKRGWAALLLLLMAGSLLVDLVHPRFASVTGAEEFPPQGLMGVVIASAARPLFGVWGSFLLVLSFFWCFCLVWWEHLPAHLVDIAAIATRSSHRVGATVWAKIRKKDAALKANASSNPDSNTGVIASTHEVDPADLVADPIDENFQPVIRQAASSENKETEKKSAPASAPRKHEHRNWTLPPLSLLKSPKLKAKGPSEEQLRETARKICQALRSFEVDGEITEISPGPIITMYEFRPAPGVRVQKIKAAATDLAMTLGAPSVRIIAPIPGKSAAGIEVPNLHKDAVVLKDVYEDTFERASKMKVPLVLGKDAEGQPVIEDLARMPHLLIGGATNMGKSVLVNSILISLLCRFTPEQLRLIIVDPKLVEFKAFENIPHLLLPIVNDPNDASQALKWAVTETKRRYLLMQKHGAKNIESYNDKISEGKITAKEGEDAENKFPYIVIIIDELAELMMTGKKDAEQSIVRLTQLARAAGIHLMMATQRPSADVVTGLIKSNCPSRASLRVASAGDSRIILDCSGAEQLLGKGDMMFTNTGPMGLRRMQGAFITDEEIEKVCEFWAGQGEPEFQDEILAPDSHESDAMELDPASRDPLYTDVLDFAREKGKISTSLIQRRFQIGYTRAARIMEQLESAGAVGEQAVAGKAREVLA